MPVLALLLVLALAAPAQAAVTPEQQLVERYAPVLMLREEDKPPCDTKGEQYEPTTVRTVLGNPRVQLVRVRKGKTTFIKNGPTAADVAGLSKYYYLNLPGDPVESECGYARDFEALKRAGRAPAVTYARIAGERGFHGLVVQYWFYWYFNQFNDLHEGDWEGMQIAFEDASTPQQALRTGPTQVVLFQHAGGETADWDSDKLQREGTHPVVYAAAGSHATFYDSAVYLQNGQGGSGLGCDNTTQPVRRLVPRPVLVPTHPTRTDPFRWLTFKGHWGQREKGFNNGPAGPNTKVVWKQPFTWMDDARLDSPTLPSSGFLGPAATPVFCGAVAVVSSFINLESRSPLGLLLLLGIVALLVLVPVLLTRWWPVKLDPLRQRRRFGQIVRAARQLYGRHWRAFVPIGLCSVAVVATIEGTQALYTALSGDRDISPSFSIGGLHFDFSVTVVGTLQPLGLTLVAAAAVAVVRLVDRGQRPGFVPAWRLTLQRFWRLVGARLLVTVLLFLMFITVIGIPFAIWKFVGWQLVQQEIVLGDKPIREALKASSQRVRGHWWRVLWIAAFLSFLNSAIGPILAFVLIFANVSLVATDILSAFIYALLVPYVAIARTLLYFDLGERNALKEVEAEKVRERV